MLALEKGEGNAETLNNVFRIIHTLKGSSGCIGLNKIESVAHVGESLLSLLRDGKLTFNPAMIKRPARILRRAQGNAPLPGTNRPAGRGGLFGLAAKVAGAANGRSRPPAKPRRRAFGLFEEEAEAPPAPGHPPVPRRTRRRPASAPPAVPDRRRRKRRRRRKKSPPARQPQFPIPPFAWMSGNSTN